MVEQIEIQKKVDSLALRLVRLTESDELGYSTSLIEEVKELVQQGAAQTRLLILAIVWVYTHKLHQLCLLHEAPSLVH